MTNASQQHTTDLPNELRTALVLAFGDAAISARDAERLAGGWSADVWAVSVTLDGHTERVVVKRHHDPRSGADEAEALLHGRHHGYPVPELFTCVLDADWSAVVTRFVPGPTLAGALIKADPSNRAVTCGR